MTTDDEYRVDIVVEGAVEAMVNFRYYGEALDYAENQAQSLQNDPGCHDWKVSVYWEGMYPPEVTDEWES